MADWPNTATGIIAIVSATRDVFSMRFISATPFSAVCLLFVFHRGRAAAAGQLLLLKSGRTHEPAHSHRFHCAARDKHEGALFFQAFVEHVHRAKMESGRVVVVLLRGFGERMRD